MTATLPRRLALAALAATAAAAGTGTGTARAQTPAQGRFAGRVVAVTGGNSGIGEATVRAFAAAGATVAFCARRDAPGRAVEASVRAAGGTASWSVVDVRDADQVRQWIDTTASRTGRLDILVNNAGIFMNPTPVEATELANFADIISTNVAGVFHGMRAALPHMQRQRAGVIVNLASVAGHRGFANTPAYSASKHAVMGLTKAAAVANARHGIRIASVSPLAVDTPMLRESFAYQNLAADAVAAALVTPRIMAPAEIAAAILMLADPAATAMTGMDLDVTGGQLA
jgi:NAD(P)-dependent dehydrogenase (short-subunit alcohol dehydrogenase family)